jgi:hypothetical protein
VELSALGGFRYLGLRESLKIAGSTTPLDDNVVFFNGDFFPSPAVSSTQDLFQTFNDFYGGQIGAKARIQWCRAFVDFTGKVALGDSHELVKISGFSSLQTTPGGPAQTLPGGILALPSNFGSVTRDQFAVVPELELKLGFQTERMAAFVGYNFLYWSRVARPGQQIDRNLNTIQIPSFPEFVPGTTQGPPSSQINGTGFTVHGLSCGLELKF